MNNIIFLPDYISVVYFHFSMYLGMQPTVSSWSSAGDEFSLVWDQCPLSEWVEIPPENKGLKFCNLLCGAIRGALEMVQLEVQAWFTQVLFLLKICLICFYSLFQYNILYI